MSAGLGDFHDSPFHRFPLFRNLSDEILHILYIAAEEHIFRKGQVVVHEGDHGDALYILGHGTVRVVKDFGLPGETQLATLDKNDFFGEMCVIEPIVRSATVVASLPSMAYSIRTATLNKIYKVWPEAQSIIMANLAEGLAERLSATDPSYPLHAY